MKKPTRLLDGYLFCKSILSTWNNGSKYAQQCYTNIQHIIDVAGYNPKLTDINGPVLKQWLEDYRDERQEAGKDCTDATLNRHLATINTIYTQLSMEGLIDYRPLFRKWKEDGHRTLWHTEEEVELLVKTAKSMGKAELADRILLAAYCGPRSSEITNLRVCDVNFETQLLEIGGTQETRTKSRKYRRGKKSRGKKSRGKKNRTRRRRMKGGAGIFDDRNRLFQPATNLYRNSLFGAAEMVNQWAGKPAPLNPAPTVQDRLNPMGDVSLGKIPDVPGIHQAAGQAVANI